MSENRNFAASYIYCQRFEGGICMSKKRTSSYAAVCRSCLAEEVGVDLEFQAVISQLGRRSNFQKATFCLADVKAYGGQIVAEHLWIRKEDIQNLREKRLYPRDELRFRGIPYQYTRSDESIGYGIRAIRLIDRIKPSGEVTPFFY